MRPTVSLLIPTFNRAELLVPCIESALAQTMTDLEVVIVDGASTDGTWDVCRRFAEADSRVRVFRDPVNTGPVRGWWRCVEEAKGTYGTFLWSDDMLYPDFLSSTLPMLLRADVAFAFTAAEIGPEPGAGLICYEHPGPLILSQEFVTGELSGGGTYPVSPACALFRMADIRQGFMTELPTDPRFDFTETGAGTDVLLYLRTAVRYPVVASSALPLAFFRAHPGSITMRGSAGGVALGYAVAKAWFAHSIGDQRLAAEILARQWLHEMRDRRRFVSPTSASRRYGNIVDTGAIVSAALLVGPRRLLRASMASVQGRTSRARPQ